MPWPQHRAEMIAKLGIQLVLPCFFSLFPKKRKTFGGKRGHPIPSGPSHCAIPAVDDVTFLEPGFHRGRPQWPRMLAIVVIGPRAC